MRGSEIQNLDRCDGSNNNHSTTQEQSLSTTLIMDRQLLRQKVHQKISVIKINTCDDITKIVHFGILIQVLS